MVHPRVGRRSVTAGLEQIELQRDSIGPEAPLLARRHQLAGGGGCVQSAELNAEKEEEDGPMQASVIRVWGTRMVACPPTRVSLCNEPKPIV